MIELPEKFNGYSSRLEYTDEQEILLRITEIEAILDNDLRDDTEEIRELEEELKELEELTADWTDNDLDEIWGYK